MATRLEPPILLSRLMMFVLASSLVILGVLLATLYNMFPLNRPQVFFLVSRMRSERQVILTDANLIPNKNDAFLRGFVREYIKARNEVVPNIGSMHRKWNNDDSSVVLAWSTDDVYKDFMKTRTWTEVMQNIPDFDRECSVEFKSQPRSPSADNLTWEISFWYSCKDSYGHSQPKSYTVQLKLDIADKEKMKWADRLNNPLGVRVSEYKIIQGDGDPLDTVEL